MKKDFKIAFFVYPSAFQSPGGGEIQLLKTKEFLEKEGTIVKLFDQWHDRLADFDVLHTFGSVKDCLEMIRTAKVMGIKNALSTICWYNWQSTWGMEASLKGRMISLVRHSAKEFFPFVPSQRKRMMQLSDILFPNSQSEAGQLGRYFQVPKEKIFIVPNGVDPVFADARPEKFTEHFGLKEFVLCVGRIEPRKNQLNMVRAFRGTDVALVFIGEYVHQYREYYEQCRKEAGKNIHFLGSINHDSDLLASAYAACNTFLLASWLETPGLAALEAGLAGAKVVITGQGATREYFQGFAEYVCPESPRDIRTKTMNAFESPKTLKLRKHIQNHYLWPHVAKKTLEGYRQLGL